MSSNKLTPNDTSPVRGVTADEVAARFRVTAASVRKWARLGRIPSFKAGTVFRFDLEDVEQALRLNADNDGVRRRG